MYAAVRRYEGVTDTQKVAQVAQEGFVPIISEMPGFVAWYLVDAGEGVIVTTSVFEHKDAEQQSTFRAGEVIAVWETYGAASETVEQEANALAEIAWLGNRLPEPEGSHLQELCRSYAEVVVHEEWPLMEQGQAPLLTQTRGTPTGWTIIDDIRANLQGIEPRTAADEQLYAEGLDQVQRLGDARRMRLVAAEEGIPAVLWAVLIFGGMAAIGFTYLFGLENTWAHRLMVVILAGVVGPG